MAKQVLSEAQKFDLRQTLHVAVLDALMASRRWEPGQLIFQGGTSLHLAHGSPRHSIDLDFLVNSALDIGGVAGAIQKRLESMHWLPRSAQLTVSKARAGHNPHAFTVTISGPNLHGSAKVKVELWQTDPQAMDQLQVLVAPIQIASGPVSGLKTFVPTAEIGEIYADKVFAVVARDFLKPRDVFDLNWLVTQHSVSKCSVEQMNVRLLTYPNMAPEQWLKQAFERRALLGEEKTWADISSDLQRWLPSSWPLSQEQGEAMAKTAIKAIEDGIDQMRVIRDERDRVNGVER